MAIPHPIRYRAIGVDTDMEARIRLKTAAQSMHQFQSIVLCPSTTEAMHEIKGGEKIYDVVFLSERLKDEELKLFIKDTRQLSPTQDAAYVLLLAATENESAKTAQSVLTGFDGCLMEPYSVDSLLQITELAARIKKERSDTRELGAIQLLLQDVMTHIDRIAYIRSCKMDVGGTVKRLKESCAVFSTFNEHCVDTYYESACDLFEEAPCNSFGEKTAYKGVSKRIKQRMVKRLLAQEEAAANNAATPKPGKS